MSISRRNLLRAVLGGAGALALPWPLARLARAASSTKHYYVFAYFEGGWDLLLGLDPRDPAVFHDDVLVETGIQPAYDRIGPAFSQTPIVTDHYELGPCVGGFAQHSATFSIVRGVNMATLTHEVGRRHFLTGRPPSGLQARGPSVGSIAATQLGADRPIPHLAGLVEAYNEGLPAYAAALPVTQVGQLRYILQDGLGFPSPSIDAPMRAALASYRAAAPDSTGGSGDTALADLYRDNQLRATELVQSNLSGAFDFTSASAAALRAHYGVTIQQLDTAAGRAMMASQALKTGLSHVVSLALSTGLDTHDASWANTHPFALQAGFDALARLTEDLASAESPDGGSWLDHTTIVAYSEFGRSPRLNSRGGRDHHIGNCALVGGGGIQGGQVVGGSSDNGMGPERIDMATGAVSAQGEVLSPEHVLATVLAAGGLDYSALRVEPLPTLLA